MPITFAFVDGASLRSCGICSLCQIFPNSAVSWSSIQEPWIWRTSVWIPSLPTPLHAAMYFTACNTSTSVGFALASSTISHCVICSNTETLATEGWFSKWSIYSFHQVRISVCFVSIVVPSESRIGQFCALYGPYILFNSATKSFELPESTSCCNSSDLSSLHLSSMDPSSLCSFALACLNKTRYHSLLWSERWHWRACLFSLRNCVTTSSLSLNQSAFHFSL